MRDNPSAWSDYELVLEGEEALDALSVRSNPSDLDDLFSESSDLDELAETFVRESKPEKAKKAKVRGSVVAKLDKGMDLTIENAKLGASYAQAELQKHYGGFLKKTIGGLFKLGLLWDRKDKPEQRQKTPGKYVESDLEEIVARVWNLLFFGTTVAEGARKRKRQHKPLIEKWVPGQSSFATYLVGIGKRVGQDYYRDRSKTWKAEQGVVEVELEALDPEVKLLGDQQLKVLVATLPKLSEKSRRVMEARLGRDRPDYERAAFREAGKLPTRTYKEMKEYLGMKTLTHVMQSLFRARKELEKVSGLPLRGLVGVARDTFGKSTRGRKAAGEPLEPAMAQLTTEQLAAIAPSKTVVRKRQNPAEVWIYFETEDDLVDLLEAGYLDEDMFHQCHEALCSMGW